MLLGTEGALRSQIKALDVFTLRICLHKIITQRFCIPFVYGVPLPLGGSQQPPRFINLSEELQKAREIHSETKRG